MSDENTHFSIRKQLEDMQQEMTKVRDGLTRLTVVNEMMHQERNANGAKLDRLDTEFTQLKGAINLLRGLVGVFGASIVGFFAWVVTSNIDDQKQMQQIHQRIAVNENSITRLHSDADQIEKKLETLYDKRD